MVKSNRLIVKADDKTRVFLNDYEAKRQQTDRDAHLDSQARTNVQRVLGDIEKGKDPGKATFVDVDPEFFTHRLTEEDEGLDDIPEAERRTILREIQIFRDRTQQKERERKHREEDIERKREQWQQPRPLEGTLNGHQHQDSINDRRTRSPSPESGQDMSDGEYARSKALKRKQQQEALFKERERRWLNRERSHMAAIQRETDREVALRDQEEKNFTRLSKRLSEWNDDVEAERGIEEYYRDHSRWWKERQAFRARERESDLMDKQNEEDTIHRNAEWMRKQAEAMTRAEPIPSAPIKLRVNAQNTAAQAAKRSTVATSAVIDEDEEERQAEVMRRKRLAQVEAHLDDVLDDDETKHRKRQERIKALVAEIPATKEGLFTWAVSWDQLDRNTVQSRIRPFVAKKIVEYLGVHEESLVDYVVGQILKRGAADAMAAELREALDEDADEFVMKLWRMVIFESESRKRGLA